MKTTNKYIFVKTCIVLLIPLWNSNRKILKFVYHKKYVFRPFSDICYWFPKMLGCSFNQSCCWTWTITSLMVRIFPDKFSANIIINHENERIFLFLYIFHFGQCKHVIWYFEIIQGVQQNCFHFCFLNFSAS